MRIFCSAKDSHIFPTKNNDEFAYVVSIYEGCPSKSWTFVITRDFVSEIL